jgi:cytochrome b561
LAADQKSDPLEGWPRSPTALLKLDWRRALAVPGRNARRRLRSFESVVIPPMFPDKQSGGTKVKSVSRYHPLLVMLHWVLACLIIAALIVGFFGLAATPNSDPQKVGILPVHMAVGVLILFLTGIRFVVRIRTPAPAEATTGYRLLDRIAQLSHYGFYVLVLLMVGSGYTTGILAGLPAIVFGDSGAPLPPTFRIYPTWVAHGYFATLLGVFIILHVVAACYHQFIRKDGLFRRMSFGRVSNSSRPVRR